MREASLDKLELLILRYFIFIITNYILPCTNIKNNSRYFLRSIVYVKRKPGKCIGVSLIMMKSKTLPFLCKIRFPIHFYRTAKGHTNRNSFRCFYAIITCCDNCGN